MGFIRKSVSFGSLPARNLKEYFNPIFIIIYLFTVALLGGGIYFDNESSGTSPTSSCVPVELPAFLIRKDHFNPNSFPYKQIRDHSEVLGKQRFEQLKCFRNLSTTPEELSKFQEKFREFRRKEIENLELFTDFLKKFERDNKYTPRDFDQLKNLLDKKKDLYYILYTKSQKLVLNNENIQEFEFKSLYESILQNHLEILGVLSPELRNEVLELLNKL